MSDDSIPKVIYELYCLDGPSDVEFLVYRMWLIEHLNAPFELSLEIATESPVDVRALLGVSIELVIAREDHTRSLFAVISQAELVGSTLEEGDSGNAGQIVVRVVCVPSVTLLRQGTASRIFQDQTVQEILTTVLDPPLREYNREFDAGTKARGTKPRDYCVQYHESDFDFATRLLEEEGISYYFHHDPDKRIEVLTLAYDNDAYGDIMNVDGSRLFPLTRIGGAVAGLESIHHFTWRASLVTTGVRRMDYDFLEPFAPLVEEQVDKDEKSRVRRLYFAGLRRYVSDDVKDRQKDHLEVAQMGGEVFSGASDAIGFRPGAVFEIDGDLADGLERTFLVTRVVHTGYAPEALHFTQSGDDDFSDDLPRYGNRFECVPSTTPIRPAQVTVKPRIDGVQTGIVAGPSGEEIHTDEHGRIIVQFHWEESSTYNEQSSCWVRVSQSWAGPSWGAMFIPRIGMEVVVTFIEGNPDRPLVTGCVYNGKSPVPYTLPAEKTKSTLKSMSSPGGNGFNEFRFEDAAGKEEIFIHAQKDFNEHVLNDHNTTVDANQTNTVNIDRTRTTRGNEFVTIHGNQTITIKGAPENQGDKTSPFKGSATEIDGHHKMITSDTAYLEAPNQIQFVCGGSSITMVPGKITISAGDGSSLTLDANALLKSSQASTLLMDANANLNANTGGNILVDANVCGTAKSGGKMLLDANALIAGSGGGSVLADANVTASASSGSTLLLDAAGAEMSGTQAKVTGTATADVSAAKVSVAGQALVAVSGALVTLN